jgi:allophanate hydrolase
VFAGARLSFRTQKYFLWEDATWSFFAAPDGAFLVYQMVSQMLENCKELFWGASLTDWQDAYRRGDVQPENVLQMAVRCSGDPAWITLIDEQRLQRQLAYLQERVTQVGGDLSRLPLYGVPFAVKDNIDVEGWPTTAACPEFAYQATSDATVVKRLRDAGAIVAGKTNLDQFATGLVGTRSSYGVVPNTFRPEYVSGGSSSGSASVVARGLVPFALATDTAGSGRVPAGYNNIVGLKPTRGWLSAKGVVPACRTLDCVSIMALTVEDAELVASVASGFDESDPYSRPWPNTAPFAFAGHVRLGVPEPLEFYGDELAARAFANAVETARGLGAEIVPIDFAPFLELAQMLYNGPWVAERLVAVQELRKRSPEAIHPTVQEVISKGDSFSALDTFLAEYRRAELSRSITTAMAGLDALLVPTAPTHYKISEVLAAPITLNSRLGVYTNFANFADLSALALPAGMREDGLPFGITLLAPAWHDRALTFFGRQWEHAAAGTSLGATDRRRRWTQRPLPKPPASIRLAVVGAHLRGMPLNSQLTSRGAVFVEQTQTAPCYRLFTLNNSRPPKDVPAGNFGAFVAEVPPPLGIGTLELIDGQRVKGFICEPVGLAGAHDITAFGGWRPYLASLAK